jgi:GTP-binding protein
VRVTSEFITSAADAAGFPREGLADIAMVGRSNVGKSSLINALVGRPLARTSAAPGKTRLANFFRVTRDGLPAFMLVDLPGYGYARGGQTARDEFDRLAAEYFASGRGHTLLLVDSRHPALDADWRAWTWLVDHGVPCAVVATKLDKLTQAERRRHLGELTRRYSGPVVAVSAHSGEGLDDLWILIRTLLREPSSLPQPPRPLPPPLRPQKPPRSTSRRSRS